MVQQVEARTISGLPDNKNMKMVKSALHTGRLYPTGDTPGTFFLLKAELTSGP
jgi:hypothetical protein